VCCFVRVACSDFSSTLKMEAARSTETSVNFYQATLCHISEDSTLHTHRLETPKCKMKQVCMPPVALTCLGCNCYSGSHSSCTSVTGIVRGLCQAPMGIGVVTRAPFHNRPHTIIPRHMIPLIHVKHLRDVEVASTPPPPTGNVFNTVCGRIT
jgi:hypothetical protein